MDTSLHDDGANYFSDILDWDVSFHIDDDFKPFVFTSACPSSRPVDTAAPVVVMLEPPYSSSLRQSDWFQHLASSPMMFPPHTQSRISSSAAVECKPSGVNLFPCMDESFFLDDFAAPLQPSCTQPPPPSPTAPQHFVSAQSHAFDTTMLDLLLAPVPLPTPSTSTKCVEPGCHNMTPYPRGKCKQLHNSKRLCNFEGCPSGPQSGGFCIKHGGGNRCLADGCNKAVQTVGKCKTHGGGVRCSVKGCNRSSQGNKRCRQHGGGKRCQFDQCTKGVQKGGYCAVHFPKSSAPQKRRGRDSARPPHRNCS